MKHHLRNIISNISSYLEIYLSGIILIGVIFSSLGVLNNLLKLFKASFDAKSFQEFLGYALALIVAIEFIKMLSRHTPGSTIEVLIFALARKLVINEHLSALELLLGVIAIGLLLWIRNFMDKNKTDQGRILSAATPVTEARKITGTNLPEGLAQTIGGLTVFFAQKDELKLEEGQEYWLGEVKVKINRLRNGIIEQIEFFNDK